MKRILFVSSETHPLIKTGGLADVAGSLPPALSDLGEDIRILMPYYGSIKLQEPAQLLSTIKINNCQIDLLETQLPGSHVKVILVDYAPFFGEKGNPYLDTEGKPWDNIAERFALFCLSAVEISQNRANLNWQPDIVHCNDWQTGLIPALLSLESDHPATVFTIHNLAYQGLFDFGTFNALNLPGQLWQQDALEYHGMFSFIKGGLVFADRITTVSPTYAEEIQTAEFGYGLEGLLGYRAEILSGIINGIDHHEWNPETDPNLAKTYKLNTVKDKSINKAFLQETLGLPVNSEVPLYGLIGRLVEQKGIDLVMDCLEEMASYPLQFVLLGSGDKTFEAKLLDIAERFPDKFAIQIGYNEKLAHQIEAGVDIFLMPSRFEPCGLNQMYSQRYGTLPIVRKTGGLADTVVDALPHNSDEGASGLVFNEASSSALMEAIKRSLFLFENKSLWKKIQKNAMAKDFSWKSSAEQYLKLYQEI